MSQICPNSVGKKTNYDFQCCMYITSIGPTGVSAESIGYIVGENLSYSIGHSVLTVYPSKLKLAFAAH